MRSQRSRRECRRTATPWSRRDSRASPSPNPSNIAEKRTPSWVSQRPTSSNRRASDPPQRIRRRRRHDRRAIHSGRTLGHRRRQTLGAARGGSGTTARARQASEAARCDPWLAAGRSRLGCRSGTGDPVSRAAQLHRRGCGRNLLPRVAAGSAIRRRASTRSRCAPGGTRRVHAPCVPQRAPGPSPSRGGARPDRRLDALSSTGRLGPDDRGAVRRSCEASSDALWNSSLCWRRESTSPKTTSKWRAAEEILDRLAPMRDTDCQRASRGIRGRQGRAGRVEAGYRRSPQRRQVQPLQSAC